jgi:hypothetical protein
VTNTPAAVAPSTTVVAVAPHASGRSFTTPKARAAIARMPSSTAIADGRAVRQRVRRAARMASTTAARWHAASSVSET